MSTKSIVLWGIGFFIFVVGLVFLVTKNQKTEPSPTTYSTTEKDRPKAQILKNIEDIGEMKVNEIKEVSFQLKNIGAKPLQILNINSSCNCTFGKITYKNFESNQFGMHKQSGYVVDIAPSDTATVKVIYNPSIMPVYGNVSRDVYITTNDPENPKLTFTIKTVVK